MKSLLSVSSTLLACAILLASAVNSPSDLVVVCNGGGALPEPAIMSFDESSGQPTARLSASAESFEGVTTGSQGELYVTCNTLGIGEVVRFSAGGQLLGSFAGDHLTTPGNVKFGPDGNLYVIGSTWPNMPARGQVLRYDAQSGAFIDYFIGPGRGVALTDLAFGPQGQLYVADFNRGVLRFNGRTGRPLGVLIPTAPGQLNSPTALAVGAGGNLFVASRDMHAVLKFRGRDGAFLGAFVPPHRGGLVSPMGLCFGPDGHLYVSSHGTHSVLKYNGRTGEFIGAFVSPESGLVYPTRLAFSTETVHVAAN